MSALARVFRRERRSLEAQLLEGQREDLGITAKFIGEANEQRRTKRIFQVIAILAVAAAFVLAFRGPMVLVYADDHGHLRFLGEARTAAAAGATLDNIDPDMEDHLVRWLELRNDVHAYATADAIDRDRTELYGLTQTNSPAKTSLDEYLKANDPAKLGRQLTRTVSIAPPTKYADLTYEADFTQHTTYIADADHPEGEVRCYHLRATTAKPKISTDDKVAATNGVGFYVADYDIKERPCRF